MHSRANILVIGSGLSGIAAAHAALQTGASVQMLDVGVPLPDATSNELTIFGSSPPWEWSLQKRREITERTVATARGVEVKTIFGSDFATRSLPLLKESLTNAKFYSSWARNGLANVWGAGLLPMRAEDMDDWPFSLAELEKHYVAVQKFMPLSGRRDPFEEMLPLYGTPKPHALSSQGNILLTRMEKYREQLATKGLWFGASRLAGDFAGKGGEGCRLCGMCMYGCPYGVLYSGTETLDALLSHPNFCYTGNYVVRSIKSIDNNVVIHGTDTLGTNREPVRGQKAIVCAGVPGTLRILLESLHLQGRPIRIKTSEQCYIPMFTWHAAPFIEQEAKHTMAQLFWLLRMPESSKNFIHLSLYGHNELYEKALNKLFGTMRGVLLPSAKLLLNRLVFAFCYLHSDYSSELIAEFQGDLLKITGMPNHQSQTVFQAVRKFLRRNQRLTGLSPFPFYSGRKLPGGGNHFGGSFPMNREPSGLQTDIWGSLPGLPGVHIADASVFPSITATTITYSVMANAHRIGEHVGKGVKDHGAGQ